MSKKNRREKQEQARAQQQQDQQKPGPPQSAPAQELPSTIDPKFLSWGWYLKIFGGCVIFTSLLYLAFVYTMKTISRNYTQDGIAMYRMAKQLHGQSNRGADTTAGELAALDAVVDIEQLKSFLLSDVAYAPAVTEDTWAWLRQQEEKYAELQQHLKEVLPLDDIQSKIRDKAVQKLEVIRECLREILGSADMQDRMSYRKKVVRLDKKIAAIGWYSQVAAGFFSWPSALDAAERSFFEALRFWTRNQEAAYWWGKTLEETAVMDVAAEKKIMAIKFDPTSALADKIIQEFKEAYDANPNAPRGTYNYAFALYRKGRVDEAVPLLKKVYEKDPGLNTFEAFLAKRRIDIIERKIDMKWQKSDDF